MLRAITVGGPAKLCLEIEFQGKLYLPFRVACTVGYAKVVDVLDGSIQAAAEDGMVEGVEELRPELKPRGLSQT